MAVKETVIAPKDKSILPEKFFLLITTDFSWPSVSGPLSYVAYYNNEETAKAAMQVGHVLYECAPNVRYVCKKEISTEKN